jgi:hypothetical protein
MGAARLTGEFDNLRMLKVKQKISGTFRNREGGDAFCRIRGYISTACKNAYSAFDAIVMASNNKSFIPKNSYAVCYDCFKDHD